MARCERCPRPAIPRFRFMQTLTAPARTCRHCNDMGQAKVANPHTRTWQPSIPPGPTRSTEGCESVGDLGDLTPTTESTGLSKGRECTPGGFQERLRVNTEDHSDHG